MTGSSAGTLGTIPKRQSLGPGQDHQVLFAAGLEEIRRTAYRVWTDHNVHDPGITALEILGYALTDLSYRASMPMPDLLASETNNAAEMKAQFQTAREILTTRPVTTGDYRKLLIDLKGVKNAWVRPTTETYFADTVAGALLRTKPSAVTGIVDVGLKGLYEVLIDFNDDVVATAARTAIIDNAKQVLQANRNLCEDFIKFGRVDSQNFILCAELEITPDAETARVQADILFQVQQYLAPPVAQYSLDEMLARTHEDGTSYGAAEIFNGPKLEHGFIDDGELAEAELREEISLSDVISIIMDIDGVRAVRDIVIDPAAPAPPPANKWRVAVDSDKKALLDRDQSRLVFYKRNMPSLADHTKVNDYWNALAAAAVAKVETEAEYDFDIPLGSYRHPAAYYSFQNHFPAVYGLSDVGIVGVLDDRRQVLAYQLKGYLLFFDQLLADYFAQLSRVRDLFSLDAVTPDLQRTYHHQVVESFKDSALIYRGANVIDEINALDSEEVRIDRRNRFLDHLIARFAESFAEFAQIMRTEFGLSRDAMISYKCKFLQDYAALSSERGLAYNYTLQTDDDLWGSDQNISGLERRLSRLLGIVRPARRNLADIEYELYPEIDSTPGDEFRFRVRRRDSNKIILSGTKHYPTAQDAREAMVLALHNASLATAYQRKTTAGGKFYFNIIDDHGVILAQRKENFATQAAMETAIAELMDAATANLNVIEWADEKNSGEGMYLIESILLRPSGATDPFLPICPDPNCAECADEDPYSYRIHIILPAFTGRFIDMNFRRWAEEVIREETPAHIQPKVCWISKPDMTKLEKLYRDWITIRSGKTNAGRLQKLTDFINELYAVKNVYFTQSLHECDSPEDQEKFIVGQTALGTMDNKSAAVTGAA